LIFFPDERRSASEFKLTSTEKFRRTVRAITTEDRLWARQTTETFPTEPTSTATPSTTTDPTAESGATDWFTPMGTTTTSTKTTTMISMTTTTVRRRIKAETASNRRPNKVLPLPPDSVVFRASDLPQDPSLLRQLRVDTKTSADQWRPRPEACSVEAPIHPTGILDLTELSNLLLRHLLATCTTCNTLTNCKLSTITSSSWQPEDFTIGLRSELILAIRRIRWAFHSWPETIRALPATLTLVSREVLCPAARKHFFLQIFDGRMWRRKLFDLKHVIRIKVLCQRWKKWENYFIIRFNLEDSKTKIFHEKPTVSIQNLFLTKKAFCSVVK